VGLQSVLLDQSITSKSPAPFLCLHSLLRDRAERDPLALALLAPVRAPLTYGRLHEHAGKVGRDLRAMGIGPQDRLAVVLANGPELAAAIVCIASNAACAVVNPAYGAEELDRYFDDLRPHALVMQAGAETPARRVAVKRGVRMIELAPADEAAGLFTLHTADPGKASRASLGPGRVALLLLTSGTTSRPKIVPLTHANVCTSAFSTVAAIGLTATDRCVNVLALFHGHGLIATIMASLAAGASVVCTPGYDGKSFFGWLKEFHPTWYSAVPTVHQAILAQARQFPELAKDCGLRLIRSASAPLPPPVLGELERTFAAPVIEFYGMTETASAPIACNPLPPRRRKPGSVGVPVGLDVAIMGETGDFLRLGETGEVVARGASVMPGYDGDATATEAVFADGWFKTGDQGFFDDDGYLFLVGRSREMINRGGENIAPREVDDVLLEHPAVAEAVSFAVPHARLGEDVAAAVVLRPQAEATAKDLRQFAMARLADFKVPRQILFVDELPKGPTGKVQRVGLAAKFRLDESGVAPKTSAAPRTPLEKTLAEIWAEVLQLRSVGAHDDFFALGGDSLLAAQALTCIYERLQIKVEISGLFDAPTVAEMAAHLEHVIEAGHVQSAASDIARVPRLAPLPASAAQQRLYRLQQALPELPFFNILYVLRLTSRVDAAVLEHSLNEIVRRHEILRTAFAVEDGRNVQTVAPSLTVPLVVDDLIKLPATKKEHAGHKLIQAELLHRFDLEHGPLLRTRLVRLAETEHLLLMTMHQTMTDGWSLGVLADELTALYDAYAAGQPSPLPPLAIQFADFAAWQRQWCLHPDGAAQLDYWRERLRGPLPVTRFAKARAKAHTKTRTKARAKSIDGDLRTAYRDMKLPAKLTQAVRAFGHSEGSTPFMALVTALLILLRARLGENDLCVATNVANRNRAGAEGLIGPLANTVVLRTHLDGDPTARELLRRVRATTLAAYAHQDVPFEDVADMVERELALNLAERCRVMLLLHGAALRRAANPAAALSFEEADPGLPMPLVTTTTYDVILVLHESAEGLVGSCIYKPSSFSAKSVDRFIGDFRKVLEATTKQPERPISTINRALQRRS